jgi:hypothetical protein
VWPRTLLSGAITADHEKRQAPVHPLHLLRGLVGDSRLAVFRGAPRDTERLAVSKARMTPRSKAPLGSSPIAATGRSRGMSAFQPDRGPRLANAVV